MSHDVTGVSVSVESGIVTLRGTVPTLWTKERAREQALKADDVMTVLDEVMVARGESDKAIADLVARRLQRYVFFTIFDDADVEVDARGRVGRRPRQLGRARQLPAVEPGDSPARGRGHFELLRAAGGCAHPALRLADRLQLSPGPTVGQQGTRL